MIKTNHQLLINDFGGGRKAQHAQLCLNRCMQRTLTLQLALSQFPYLKDLPSIEGKSTPTSARSHVHHFLSA